MTSRSVFLFAVLLCIPLSQGLCGEEHDDSKDKNVFVSAENGFRIARPDGSWGFHETGSVSMGTYRLVVFSKKAKSKVQFTVRVMQPASTPGDANALRDKTLKWTHGKKEYADRSKETLTIAGRKAPGLAVDQESKGELYRVHQFYLLEHGVAFTLGYHAPAAEFDAHLPAFQRIAGTFRFIAATPEVERQRRLRALAARCGTEVPWLSKWREAAAKARRDHRLILVLVRSLSGFQISNPFLTSTFMNPDIVELVRHRFVVLRFQKGMGAPFESHSVYGLGPSTFGTSLLVATPGGRVVGDTFSPEPSSVYDLLVETLAANREFCAVTPPESLKGADRGAWLLSRGELDRAAALLRSPSSPREHRMKASLLRRHRKGEEALREIEKAREGRDGVSEADLDVEEAAILLRMGKIREAYAVLTGALHRFPGHPRSPEALFGLGACSFYLSGAKSAKTVWTGLIEKHPENRWSWLAAAIMTSTSFSLGLAGRPTWPSREILATLRIPELQKRTIEDAPRAEKEAVEYLLREQRTDGSWISPTEVSGAVSKKPHEFTVAVTALCGLSLLPYREDARIARAVHLAVGFLLHAREVEKVVGEKIYYMDYSVWSKAYTIRFFAECIEKGILKKGPFEPMLNELAAELQAKQKSGGGWSYYVTRDLRTAGRSSDQSISFSTAAVLLALHKARAIGLAVPLKMVEGGLGCLKRMKNPDGTFEYMLHHGNENATRKPNLEGAAGRGPLCALTLYRWDRGDLDAIRKALHIFADYREKYSREKRKSLMHTGLGGQGSHYLMFDYAYAAVALAQLSKQERMVFRNVLLDQILDSRAVDGSYVDNPLNGSHVGTALALIAFQHLREGG